MGKAFPAPGRLHLIGKPRNGGGAEIKECLTKLKEVEASVTKLACRPAMRRHNKDHSL